MTVTRELAARISGVRRRVSLWPSAALPEHRYGRPQGYWFGYWPVWRSVGTEWPWEYHHRFLPTIPGVGRIAACFATESGK